MSSVCRANLGRGSNGHLGRFERWEIAAVSRLQRKIGQTLHHRLSPLILPLKRRDDLEDVGGRNGTAYGRFRIPLSLLRRDMVCYCAGVGEDISFEEDLIRRVGCQVVAFDPTPRSIQFIAQHAAGLERFQFQPIGLWKRDETLRFYEPENPKNVSHSVVEGAGQRKFFEAPCRRLSSYMREHGHTELGLLKMNIEGAELAVFETLIEDDVRPLVILSTIDHPSYFQAVAAVRRVIRYGYDLVHVSSRAYTWVRRTVEATSPQSVAALAACRG